MQPLQNCIGPTIRIGQEILCLPYVRFFIHLYAVKRPWSSFIFIILKSVCIVLEEEK